MSAELRDASSKAEEIMDEFSIEASMREDIFLLVDKAWEKAKKGGSGLDGESLRLLEKERKSYIRNGLGIEKGPKRDRFKEIKKRLSMVCGIKICRVTEEEADIIRSRSSSRRTLMRRTAVFGSQRRNLRVCRMMFLRASRRVLATMRANYALPSSIRICSLP